VPPELVGTLLALAESNLYGLVWLDEDLSVVDHFGGLVADVRTGLPVVDELIGLVGYEADLHAIARLRGETSLTLANLVMPIGATSAPCRVNVLARWIEPCDRLAVLVSRAMPRGPEELEVQRQARLRQVAEEALRESRVELERANRELTRANRELDSFAYVLSHDLKSPLRALRQLTGDLQREIGSIDGEGRLEPLCAAIRQQTVRMSSMMTGLYEYARVGRESLPIDHLDTRALIDGIVASLPHPGGLEVRVVGSWPRVLTVEAAFDLVLRNLLENALRHHDRYDGFVEIAAREEATDLVIEVSDDGPGIPMEYRRAVFDPFTRLGEHPPAADSSGIGLSLVAKTVETIGGRIDIVGPPGRGVTFRVAWPLGGARATTDDEPTLSPDP
jgi:signal transduction histidine kinase